MTIRELYLNDLVGALREHRRGLSPKAHAKTIALMAAAADEIERLRTTLSVVGDPEMCIWRGALGVAAEIADGCVSAAEVGEEIRRLTPPARLPSAEAAALQGLKTQASIRRLHWGGDRGD